MCVLGLQKLNLSHDNFSTFLFSLLKHCAFVSSSPSVRHVRMDVLEQLADSFYTFVATGSCRREYYGTFGSWLLLVILLPGLPCPIAPPATPLAVYNARKSKKLNSLTFTRPPGSFRTWTLPTGEEARQAGSLVWHSPVRQVALVPPPKTASPIRCSRRSRLPQYQTFSYCQAALWWFSNPTRWTEYVVSCTLRCSTSSATRKLG